MEYDQQVDQTDKAIHDAFFCLLEDKDLDDITFSEIVQISGVDHETLHLRYASVTSIIDEYKNRAFVQAKKVLSETDSHDLRRLFEGLSSIVEEDMQFYQVVAGKKCLHFMRAEFKDLLKNSFYDAYQKTSRHTPAEFGFGSEFVSSGIIAIYIDWLTNNHGLTLAELTNIGVRSAAGSWSDLVGV